MEPLQIQFIFEVLGRPPENVSEALKLLVEKIGTENGTKVLERRFNPPVLVKDSKDLYTSFAEVTLEVDSLERLLPLLTLYMPSHAELIYPEKIDLTNADLNLFFNQLLQRLHNYDAVTKHALLERDILLQKIKEGAPHLLPQVPKSPNTIVQTKKEDKKKSKAKKK